MDNRGQQKTPGETGESSNLIPDDWLSEAQHDPSKIGESAIKNAAITSSPDDEAPLPPSPEEVFKITDEQANAPAAPAATDQDDSSHLVFDPMDIAPKEKGLSPSAETALHKVRDLFSRGNSPKDAYENYQQLRDIIANEGQKPDGSQGK